MFEQTFKNIDDILWKEAGCQSELDYVEQTSWIIFLKYLDDLERERRTKAELTGKDYEGIIHAASPEPVINKTFFKLLRSAVNIPFAIPLPAWLLQIGGQFAGTEAGLLLAGRRVVSKVLVEKDFVFSYPALETALDDLLHRETEAEEAIFADRPVLN